MLKMKMFEKTEQYAVTDYVNDSAGNSFSVHAYYTNYILEQKEQAYRFVTSLTAKPGGFYVNEDGYLRRNEHYYDITTRVELMKQEEQGWSVVDVVDEVTSNDTWEQGNDATVFNNWLVRTLLQTFEDINTASIVFLGNADTVSMKRISLMVLDEFKELGYRVLDRLKGSFAYFDKLTLRNEVDPVLYAEYQITEDLYKHFAGLFTSIVVAIVEVGKSATKRLTTIQMSQDVLAKSKVIGMGNDLDPSDTEVTVPYPLYTSTYTYQYVDQDGKLFGIHSRYIDGKKCYFAYVMTTANKIEYFERVYGDVLDEVMSIPVLQESFEVD